MNIARRFGALALSGGTVGSLLVALDGEFFERFFFEWSFSENFSKNENLLKK